MDFFKNIFGPRQRGRAQQSQPEPEVEKQPEEPEPQDENQEENSNSDIIYEKSWRKYGCLEGEWDKKYSDTLLDEIQQTSAKLKSGKLNIMMIGQVQSGKSSTINSFFSIAEGQITSRVRVGKSDSSYSIDFHIVPGEGELEHIVFHDTMGIELAENQGIHIDDISSATKGQLKPGYQFNPMAPAKVEKPDVDRRCVIHCVIYIVDAENIFSEIVQSFETRIKELENVLFGPNRMVIVTKIDNISNIVKDDITKIFKSENVERVVESAKNTFGVPKNYVFPVKNYTDEAKIEHFKNIPLLLALRQAAYFGADFMRGTEVDNVKK
ncbi:interferon-induced protein 44-like [Mercenaria mercenaria]|uniref:interferon-induced protein 44-like n=1 Tax=Mercenaria mercenaria TaxID=6596 RepID=UPI00234F5ED2|nr:interferon-induced protein 44-like [Mercenaria mercenaria]